VVCCNTIAPVACCELALLGLMGSLAATTEDALGIVRQLVGGHGGAQCCGRCGCCCQGRRGGQRGGAAGAGAGEHKICASYCCEGCGGVLCLLRAVC
jgi:hypothetical protein